MELNRIVIPPPCNSDTSGIGLEKNQDKASHHDNKAEIDKLEFEATNMLYCPFKLQ